MYLLAEQPYFKVEREVNSIEQVDIELERTIYLYDEKIVTKHREFLIHEVLDISYHSVGEGGGGILYVHTSKGVFPYIVKSSPHEFVEAYKTQIK